MYKLYGYIFIEIKKKKKNLITTAFCINDFISVSL